MLQKTPFSFDVSVWEFFWPLIVGARLVVAAPGAHRDPAQLSRRSHAHGVTTLHFVPSMLQAFVEHVALRRADREQRRSARTGVDLRCVICSGEALPAELRDQVARHLPQVQLENLYGPTEASIDVTRWACAGDQLARGADRPSDLEHAGLCAGRRLEPVPAGVVGRALHRGCWVWRGAIWAVRG